MENTIFHVPVNREDRDGGIKFSRESGKDGNLKQEKNANFYNV